MATTKRHKIKIYLTTKLGPRCHKLALFPTGPQDHLAPAQLAHKSHHRDRVRAAVIQDNRITDSKIRPAGRSGRRYQRPERLPRAQKRDKRQTAGFQQRRAASECQQQFIRLCVPPFQLDGHAGKHKLLWRWVDNEFWLEVERRGMNGNHCHLLKARTLAKLMEMCSL